MKPDPPPMNGPPTTTDPVDRQAVFRILDANANRLSEGLRVIEEYCRFALADPFLSGQLKQLRHDWTEAAAELPEIERLAARDTQRDPGVELTTSAEFERADLQAVVAANLARCQQSLRVIEEYGKTVAPSLARRTESLRYRLYVLAQALLRGGEARRRLADARLYVLVDGGRDADDFETRCRALLAGGAQVLQLRDKRLDDRTLLTRARRLREWTAAAGVLFVMNDRPDLARLARADGVHVGQEELPVHEVRAIVGPELLVGVSTHSTAQARQAVLDGADYLGCGPTFPSTTKSFDAFPGLAFLREVAAEIGLPAFAIGGVGLDNLSQVLAAGLRRVAVSGAAWSAASPADAARAFRAALDAPPADATLPASGGA